MRIKATMHVGLAQCKETFPRTWHAWLPGFTGANGHTPQDALRNLADVLDSQCSAVVSDYLEERAREED
jgi:hypothetical protein